MKTLPKTALQRRPLSGAMAAALAADSELLFLIDFSATTHPSPNPAPYSETPRQSGAEPPALLPPWQAEGTTTTTTGLWWSEETPNVVVPVPCITRGQLHGWHPWLAELLALLQHEHRAAGWGRRNISPERRWEAKVETFCQCFLWEKAYLQRLCLFLHPDYHSEIANTLLIYI